MQRIQKTVSYRAPPKRANTVRISPPRGRNSPCASPVAAKLRTKKKAKPAAEIKSPATESGKSEGGQLAVQSSLKPPHLLSASSARWLHHLGISARVLSESSMLSLSSRSSIMAPPTVLTEQAAGVVQRAFLRWWSRSQTRWLREARAGRQLILERQQLRRHAAMKIQNHWRILLALQHIQRRRKAIIKLQTFCRAKVSWLLSFTAKEINTCIMRTWVRRIQYWHLCRKDEQQRIMQRCAEWSHIQQTEQNAVFKAEMNDRHLIAIEQARSFGAIVCRALEVRSQGMCQVETQRREAMERWVGQYFEWLLRDFRKVRMRIQIENRERAAMDVIDKQALWEESCLRAQNELLEAEFVRRFRLCLCEKNRWARLENDFKIGVRVVGSTNRTLERWRAARDFEHFGYKHFECEVGSREVKTSFHQVHSSMGSSAQSPYVGTFRKECHFIVDKVKSRANIRLRAAQLAAGTSKCPPPPTFTPPKPKQPSVAADVHRAAYSSSPSLPPPPPVRPTSRSSVFTSFVSTLPTTNPLLSTICSSNTPSRAVAMDTAIDETVLYVDIPASSNHPTAATLLDVDTIHFEPSDEVKCE